jgi:capsular exopolysaccharide synthesis family protein
LDQILSATLKTWNQKANQASARVQANLPKTPPVSADLEAKRLTLEKENASRMVENLQAEYDRARRSTGGDFFKIHIVDEARPAEYQSPGLGRRLVFAFAAFLFACFPGLLWVVLRQVVFARIYSRDDVERKLRAKVLGGVFFLPLSIPPQKKETPVPVEEAAESSDAPKIERFGEAEPRLLHWGKGSTFLQVENYRLLCSQIKSFFSSPEHLAFLVTSTQPGEGKTLFSPNSANSFARAGRKTLLVDADMRRGRLSEILGVKPGVGLMELLSAPGLGEETRKLVSESVFTTQEKNLYFLRRGADLSLAGDSAGKEKFKSLVQLLRKAFDVLIVDTPPVIVAADPLNLMDALPNVVFVVRSGETRAADAQEAFDLALGRKVRMACVLNAVEPSPFLKNHFAKYGYYYTPQG